MWLRIPRMRTHTNTLIKINVLILERMHYHNNKYRQNMACSKARLCTFSFADRNKIDHAHLCYELLLYTNPYDAETTTRADCIITGPCRSDGHTRTSIYTSMHLYAHIYAHHQANYSTLRDHTSAAVWIRRVLRRASHASTNKE